MIDVASFTRYGATAAGLFTVLAAGALLFAELNRPVEQIRIEGQLTGEERRLIEQALTGHADARILTASLSKVVADVDALGWPQNVTVRRDWPDTLVLRINKQGVIARWKGDQYLTSNGRVINEADVTGELPSIEVESISPEVALSTLQQLDERARLHGLRIAQLRHSAAQGWWLHQDDGVRVNLGRGHSKAVLLTRYQRFLRVRSQLSAEQRSGVEYADVRYANGVALKARSADDPALLIGQAESTRTVIDGR
ncbi:MAG: cell division protein FtsQ/DivIB [Pseudomonadales bacterium]